MCVNACCSVRVFRWCGATVSVLSQARVLQCGESSRATGCPLLSDSKPHAHQSRGRVFTRSHNATLSLAHSLTIDPPAGRMLTTRSPMAREGY